MDFLQVIFDKLGDAAFSNQIRTVVALLAVPGALWGTYLFIRWMGGRGIVAEIERIQVQNRSIQEVLCDMKVQIAAYKSDLNAGASPNPAPSSKKPAEPLNPN